MVQIRKDDRKGLSQTDFAQSAAHIEMHLNHLIHMLLILSRTINLEHVNKNAKYNFAN